MSITHRRRPFLARTLAALATFATLAAAPALTACSDDSPAAPAAPAEEKGVEIAGTYALEQVDGNALPFDDGSVVWDAMTLTLGSDRTVVGTIGWHEMNDEGLIVDEGTDSFSGSYASDGNRLMLHIEDDAPLSAVLDGDVLTITTVEGRVLLFRRG